MVGPVPSYATGDTPPACAGYRDDLTGLCFVQAPAGDALMGTQAMRAAVREMQSPDPRTVWDEAPRHRVIFDKPFFISSTETTQSLWHDVMQTRPGPEQRWQQPDWRRLPVTGVSWNDTQAFIARLKLSTEHYRYRLPTEAEWEYAARTAKTGLRPFAIEQLDAHAWTRRNAADTVQPVATRKSNAWGLYDMLGNAREWVADWYDANIYAISRMESPVGPAGGVDKVIRGGASDSPFHMARPGYRDGADPGYTSPFLGFRLVIEARQPPPYPPAH
jgi:formylglycine-generating enzyme required for sulfatase activity